MDKPLQIQMEHTGIRDAPSGFSKPGIFIERLCSIKVCLQAPMIYWKRNFAPFPFLGKGVGGWAIIAIRNTLLWNRAY